MRSTNTFAIKRDDPKKHRESVAESRMTRSSFGDFGGNERMKNTKSILYIMLVFLGMAYAGITFIFSIMAYQDTSSKTWNISQIVTNWKLKPIVAITATTEKECAEGYEPITGYKWPGTFEGCHCDGNVPEIKLQNTLVKGECDKIQHNNGCVVIDERNPIIIRRFYQQYLICVQRAGQDIIDTQRPTKDAKGETVCTGDDYIICGPQGSDIENKLCVKADQDCPIIALKYGKSDNPPEGEWSEVRLSDTEEGNSLFYSNVDESGGLPIVEFKLTENGYICIKEDDINRPKTKEVYNLLNDNFYQGCVTNVDGVTKDGRWELIFNVTELEMYQNDDLFRDKVHDLPDYVNEEKMAENNYQFFYRNYIRWDRACALDDVSEMKKLAENLNPINTLANAQLFFMVICFLSLLVLGITTPVFVMIRHCMILRGETKETYKDVIISTGIRVINFIFIVIKAAFLISCLVLIENYHQVYTRVRDHGCTDDTTEYVLEYVDEYIQEAKKADWVSLSAVIVIAFCELTAVVVLLVLQRKASGMRHDARQSLLESLAMSKD